MNFAQTAPIYHINTRIKGKGAAILNSKCAKYSSISMLLNTSKTPVNPERLTRELQRIEPRIKSLENDACSLRNLVPIGLKDMLDQTKDDIDFLNEIYSNSLSNNSQETQNEEVNNDENNDSEKDGSSKIELDEELSELQKRVFMRLDSSLESALKMLQDSLTKEKNEKSAKLKAMNKKLFDIEEDYLEEVQQRVENSTESINDRNTRTKNRIKAIQDKTLKLYDQFFTSAKNDGETTAQKLKSIEEDCINHRSEITDIKAKIDSLKQQLSNDVIKAKKSPKMTPQSSNLNDTIESKKTETISTVIPPDLSNQFEELKEESAKFKNEFERAVSDLKKEADDCENESRELTQMIASISASTETIEANANSASKLTHELQDKVNELSSKIEQQEYRKSLLAIVGQIKSTNEKIAEEIKEMKKKIILPVEPNENDNVD